VEDIQDLGHEYLHIAKERRIVESLRVLLDVGRFRLNAVRAMERPRNLQSQNIEDTENPARCQCNGILNISMHLLRPWRRLR
jgi:hypothetical protein